MRLDIYACVNEEGEARVRTYVCVGSDRPKLRVRMRAQAYAYQLRGRASFTARKCIQCFNFVFLTTARMGSGKQNNDSAYSKNCKLHAVTAVDDRFVQIPTDQEPVEGDHFSVTCSSDAPTFIVWYKEGQIIPSTSHHFTQTSSAVGGTLSIDSVHHDLHTGLYECVAVFPDSFTASVAFSITVKCEFF